MFLKLISLHVDWFIFLKLKWGEKMMLMEEKDEEALSDKLGKIFLFCHHPKVRFGECCVHNNL